MANRFSQTTTAGFKGLSLDEIMAIPLAKQARQDASLAATDELQALEAKRLESDAPVVDAELERIRKESEQISKDLMERGVDRNLSNKLRSLRSSQKKSFGASGVVGQAEANYKAAQTYINDLATKKEQQAGWSPQQAKMWATQQVSKFGSSFDELGNFRQFQGKGLASKVDTSDWILGAIKNVEKDKMPIELQNYYGLDGKLDIPQFQQALASGSIETRSLNKIMSSLVLAAKNDEDLKNSLLQEAAINGIDPNKALDFGSLTLKELEGGKKEYVWSQGESSFGRQLYGLAYGAQSTDRSIKYDFLTDSIGKKLYEDGLVADEARNMVRAANGEYNTITSDNIDQIRDNTDLALQEIELREGNLSAIWTKEKIASNPQGYERALGSVNDAKVKYYNLKNRIDSIEKVATENVSERDKKLYDANKALKVEIGGKNLNLAYADGSLDKALIKAGVTPTKLDGLNKRDLYLARQKDLQNYFIAKGVAMEGVTPGDFEVTLLGVEGKVKGAIDDYLDSSDGKYAESYTEFTALSTGKYSSEIGAVNKLLSEGFDGAGYSDSYTGEDMSQYVKENYYDEDNPEKFKTEIRVTDGYGPDGYPMEHLLIKNDKGIVLETKQVTRGINGRKEHRQVSIELMKSSDPDLQTKGKHMMANYNFMPAIKKGLIRSGAMEGILPDKAVNIKGKQEEIRWTKDPTDESWRIIIGDFTSREIFGETDMAMFMAEELVDELKKLQGK